MSDKVIIESVFLDLLADPTAASAEDLDLARAELARGSHDRATQEMLVELLFQAGDITSLARPLDALTAAYEAERTPLPEALERVRGFLSLARTGILLPARRPPRTRPHPERVLGFYHAVPPYATSGYAVRTHQLAKAAQEHGRWTTRHHARIGFPWDLRGRHKNPDERSMLHDGVPYLHDKGAMGTRGDLHQYILRAAARIRHAIYLERPAIVHAASAYVNALPALLAARSMGVPFVYEVRGLWEVTAASARPGWEQTDRFRLEKQIETLLVQEADGVVAISEGVRGELLARGVDPARLALSPNGISDDTVALLPRDAARGKALGLDPAVPTLGYIGSFVEYEGLELLLEAVARLRSEGLVFNVLLVGDGPHYKAVLQRRDELGLAQNVSLPGRVPHEEVSALYSLIDIAVYPRLPSEVCELVTPLKPLEALWLGKLVIGSSVGGIRESLRHGVNGLLFEAGRLDELVATLRRAVVDLPAFAELRAAGRSWVRENRRWESSLRATEALYDRLAPAKEGLAQGPRALSCGTVSLLARQSLAETELKLRFKMQSGAELEHSYGAAAAESERHVPLDAVAPPGAVAVTAASFGTQRDIAVDTRPLEAFSDIAPARSLTLAAAIPLEASACQSDRLSVRPGARYTVHLRLFEAAEVHDHALIGLVFHGAQQIDPQQVGLLPLGSAGDTAYAYVAQTGPVQRVRLRVPPGVTEMTLFARRWRAHETRPVIVSSTLLLEEADETTGGARSFQLRRRQPDGAGDLAPQEALLADLPFSVSVSVTPGARFTVEGGLSARDPALIGRAAILTYSYSNRATGEQVRCPSLPYSEKFGCNFTYLDATGRFSVSRTPPPGADTVELGLRRWTAKPGLLTCQTRLLVQGESRLAINWNLDRSANNILLFADLNLNLVDGSAVWLVSMATALARLPGAVVHLLLRNPLLGSPFIDDLNTLPNLRIIDPESHLGLPRGIASEDAAAAINDLDAAVGGFDHIVVRGFEVNAGLLRHARLHGRLNPYLTDIPQTDEALTPELRDRLDLVMRRAEAVWLQSRWLIDFVARHFPHHAALLRELPPMLPELRDAPVRRAGGEVVEPPDGPSVVYAGKMAPEWGILELLDAVQAARETVTGLTLHVIGSKIHNPPEQPDYQATVARRLANDPGVVWHRSLDRQSILRMLPGFTLGWGWRDPAFEEANLELSTKLLEYAQAGLPVVLADTARYRSLLGKTYPFLARNGAEAAEALRKAVVDARARKRAVKALGGIVGRHLIGTVAEEALAPALPKRRPVGKRVLLAGHDLKFAGDLEAALIAAGHSVTHDLWKGHTKHDEAQSRHLLQQADIVFCEWALGNLEWYSQNLLPGQRLLVRLHAQEIATGDFSRVNWARVERVIFVSDHYRELGLREKGVPEALAVTVANSVNLGWFRPAVAGPGSKVIGLLGAVPFSKRPDRAVEILRRVVRRDPGFRLSIKGKLPKDYNWMKGRNEELAAYGRMFREVMRAPELAGRVSFEPQGADVPLWAGRLEAILSTSDAESFHLAVPEAVACGATPVILPWPGAERLYPADWIVADEAAAAERILRVARMLPAARAEMQARDLAFVQRHFAAEKVCARLLELINGP